MKGACQSFLLTGCVGNRRLSGIHRNGGGQEKKNGGRGKETRLKSLYISSLLALWDIVTAIGTTPYLRIFMLHGFCWHLFLQSWYLQKYHCIGIRNYFSVYFGTKSPYGINVVHLGAPTSCSILKPSVPTSQETHCALFTKTNLLMLFRELFILIII
jgi:hypothetical protein